MILADLKISKQRTLKHFQAILIDKMKPAHPDQMRALKEEIRTDVSRVRAKIVNSIMLKQTRKEETIVQCI